MLGWPSQGVALLALPVFAPHTNLLLIKWEVSCTLKAGREECSDSDAGSFYTFQLVAYFDARVIMPNVLKLLL